MRKTLIAISCVYLGTLVTLTLLFVACVLLDFHRPSKSKVDWASYSASVFNVLLAPLNVLALRGTRAADLVDPTNLAVMRSEAYPWTKTLCVNRGVLRREVIDGSDFLLPVSRWEHFNTLGQWKGARVKWHGEGQEPNLIARTVFPVAGGAAKQGGEAVHALVAACFEPRQMCPEHRSPWGGSVRALVVLEGSIALTLEGEVHVVTASDEEAFVYDPSFYHSLVAGGEGPCLLLMADLRKEVDSKSTAWVLQRAYRHLAPKVG